MRLFPAVHGAASGFLLLLKLAAPFFSLLCAAGAQAQGMGAEEARHLLNRTGFEARIEAIDAFAALSRGAAIERIVEGTQREARTPAPEWVNRWEDPRSFRQASGEERKRAQGERIEQGLALKGWWLNEMLATRSPLTERMTLFWHNHFTSSLQKVRSPVLMYRQNALLRRHALGSFAQLLHAASKDPAMLVYLDSARNRRGQPNENFAREVMELFTLGEGHYGEQDIREAARAFTGWSIEPQTGEYVFRPMLHDGGEKTVLGRSGAWRGEDVLEILLAQPATAEFIVAKLWREFVSPQPDAAAVRRIAAQFRESDYQVKVALRQLLHSEAFWAPESRGALVKSPVELVVGTLRQFDVGYTDPLPFVLLLRNLGQDLFSPPNVRGWPGGEAWIDTRTLLARKAFLERLMRVDEMRLAPMPAMAEKPMARRAQQAMLELRFSADDWLRGFRGREQAVQTVLLALAPAADVSTASGADRVRALTADPVYQLK